MPQTFRVANAMRVDHSPKIDGRIDDPQWKLAEPITNFAQREPYEGPPTGRTEVRILYTRDAVFNADLNLKPRPKVRGVRELSFESFLFHAPDTHGVLQTQEWQATFRAEFHSGAYVDDDIVDVLAQRIITPFNALRRIGDGSFASSSD